MSSILGRVANGVKKTFIVLYTSTLAKNSIFDPTGTSLSSTNAEDAIKEVVTEQTEIFQTPITISKNGSQSVQMTGTPKEYIDVYFNMGSDIIITIRLKVKGNHYCYYASNIDMAFHVSGYAYQVDAYYYPTYNGNANTLFMVYRGQASAAGSMECIGYSYK